MKIPVKPIAGLPKEQLIEKCHYYNQQSDVAQRMLGFYLRDMDQQGVCDPFANAALAAASGVDVASLSRFTRRERTLRLDVADRLGRYFRLRVTAPAVQGSARRRTAQRTGRK